MHPAGNPVSYALAITALFAASGAATPLHAQSRWSVDAVAGVANVSGGDYGVRQRSGGGARVDFRIAGAGPNSIFIGAAIGTYVGYQPLIIAPTIPCFNPVTGAPASCNYPELRPGVPNFSYLSGHAGVEHAIGSAVSVDLDAGAGQVHASSATSGNRLGVTGDLNVIFHIAPPVHLVFGAQVLSWTENGNTLYAYPVTLGMRIQ